MVSDKCLIYTILVTMFIYNDTFGIAHPKMAALLFTTLVLFLTHGVHENKSCFSG